MIGPPEVSSQRYALWVARIIALLITASLSAVLGPGELSIRSKPPIASGLPASNGNSMTPSRRRPFSRSIPATSSNCSRPCRSAGSAGVFSVPAAIR